jgi:hypothetical protein
MNISSANVPFDQTIGPNDTLKVGSKGMKSDESNLDKSVVFGTSLNNSPDVSPDKFNPY